MIEKYYKNIYQSSRHPLATRCFRFFARVAHGRELFGGARRCRDVYIPRQWYVTQAILIIFAFLRRIFSFHYVNTSREFSFFIWKYWFYASYFCNDSFPVSVIHCDLCHLNFDKFHINNSKKWNSNTFYIKNIIVVQNVINTLLQTWKRKRHCGGWPLMKGNNSSIPISEKLFRRSGRKKKVAVGK